MPSEVEQSANIAQDAYDAYYAEKLWQWIPGFYREKDARTNTPGTLRTIVETMGGQSADLRRTLDRIWENHFVELADDDALEQLGALVATRMVHQLNPRARRVDVARTIFYRRRKGTPWVLERLLADITGWTGSHLDTRRRLARSYHLLDPQPQLGRVTQTPRGGWANLRSPRIPALAWTAFEELNHTPDFRRYPGRGSQQGRYGISKIGVHAHRMRALEINYPTAVRIGTSVDPYTWALDPSGRAAPLFQPAKRPSGDQWSRSREWQMPRAIERRLLAHAEYQWTDADIAALPLTPAAITVLQKYSGFRFRSAGELSRLINSHPDPAKSNILLNFSLLRAAALVEGCGSAQLYGADLDGGNQALTMAVGTDKTAVASTREAVLAGNLSLWGAAFHTIINGPSSPYDLVIDPHTGAVITDALDKVPIARVIHYGAACALGAGSYDRRASIETTDVNLLDDGGDALGPVALTPSGLFEVTDEIVDSKTYVPPEPLELVESYRLQAANNQRPYLRVSNDEATWTISAKPKDLPTDLRCLVFDGLWIGIQDTLDEIQDPVPATGPCEIREGKITLTNTWDRVEIRNCTLDPGGEQLRPVPTQCQAIPYVQLELTGYVEELIIESSVLGPILENVAGADPCSVGKIIIRDSVIHAPDMGEIAAITTAFGEVHIERCTIVGDIVANRLYVSDSIILGSGTIADRQHGCFRFSAAVEGNWPRPFESHFYTQFSAGWFDSIRFGDPDYARLSQAAPVELKTGAENHCEMGACNKLLEQIKRADLQAKLEEFMPYDLIEQFVNDN
ncbi:hypothetical protein DB30_02528 [Enhygromyxa salina]|uniref:Uncharacterized protein n=1 Tax=Enhygromyxa salina TaxID=215803 RepID=A0A0C2D8F5_9BACT|nr:hypothetical protein [Enhygromyxa salina]KIG17905.1 hypothetical protein DB30_02528 [Enhygromyxa salina]